MSYYQRKAPQRRTTGNSSVAQSPSMELVPHSSHTGHAMSSQMMSSAVARMGNPLPGFHPLASRTNLYVQPSPAPSIYPTYPPAPKVPPPAIPHPPMIQQQQLPIHPEVTLKRIPFYEVQGELLRPSTLIHNQSNREPGATFHFYLTPSQADAVSFHREISMGKSDYLYQIQMRFCSYETSCEQEDSFPPGLIVKVNGKACQLPPGPVPVNKPPAEIKRPPRPVNISALCKLCPSVTNTLHMNWTPDYTRGGTYVVGVWLVKKLTASDLLEKLKSKGPRSAEHTTGTIREKLNEDGDCDIATTSLRVSLVCPLGKMRMCTPVRPLTCTHLQCFDATIFLQMNEKKPTWMCPVCNKPALYDNLVIDGYFLDVLTSSNIPEDCQVIQLNKDGSWSTHNPSSSKKTASEVPKNESVQEINDLDSDDSMDNGIGSSENGGLRSINGDGSTTTNKVILVDLTVSESEDDEPPIKQTAPPVIEKATTNVITKAESSDASSNGSGQRSSPSIIMLDSPSPPPRDPSPRLPPPQPAPAIQPSAPATPANDIRSPYLSPSHNSHISVASPQAASVSPLISNSQQPSLLPPPILPPHPYQPLPVHQVHPPQDHPSLQPQYTNFMPFHDRYHPY